MLVCAFIYGINAYLSRGDEVEVLAGQHQTHAGEEFNRIRIFK